ncbi:MAG: cytochrome P450, partial [Pseudomonadales bacterium]|nr:cytochrome P450 [Pseudomonadales bacterium]
KYDPIVISQNNRERTILKIDLLNPVSYQGGQPHDQFAWLRENAPVYWHEEPGGAGYWAVTRHADVYQVGRDTETFSSEPTIMISDEQLSPQLDNDHKMMLMMDPPDHTVYRKLISREFTQGPARNYSPRIRELATLIVDNVIERGECDFVTDIAGEMPSYVIAEMVGLPLEDGRKLYELTETIHTAPEMLPENAIPQAVMKMFEYGTQVMQEKRAHPTNDLASKLLHSEVDGRKMDDIDFLLFFMLLIDAGGDTTRNLVAGGMLSMLENPDQLNWLTENLPDRIASARDELLRYTSPVIYMRRTAKQDTVLRGQQIKAGDKVVMYYGAANRDAEVFDNPEALNLGRTPNKHLAFGGGAHVCLGQWFARLEIDALLMEVLARMKNMELTGDPQWLASNFISGPRTMPVRFTPAARLAG